MPGGLLELLAVLLEGFLGNRWDLQASSGAAFKRSSARLDLLLYLKEPRINQHVICKYHRDNKEMNNSQHRFVKNKSYQANLISFYASLLGKGKAVVLIWLSFRRAFNVASFSTAARKHWLNEPLSGKRNVALDGGEEVFSRCLCWTGACWTWIREVWCLNLQIERVKRVEVLLKVGWVFTDMGWKIAQVDAGHCEMLELE